jgi:hypothetical protein
LVALYYRLKEFSPLISAVDVARSQSCSFAIPELVEKKQRMIADALEVSVVGRSFLLAMYWTLRAVHIQNDTLVDSVGHGPFYPLGVQLG